MVALSSVLAAGAFTALGMMAGSGPAARFVLQSSNRLKENTIPNPSEAINLRWKRKINEAQYFTVMSKWGINKDLAKNLYFASENILRPAELISLKRRGVIEEGTFDLLMKQNGLELETVKWMETVTEYMPTPQDMIRFAVREVFRDDVSKRFGMDDDFPEKIVTEGAKIGLKEEHLHQYWRAHWDLPSTQLGFEMFHRLNPEFETEHPVSKDDLETLLKIQDVLPFWRPRLMKVAHAMPTRVDIRRMLDAGMISEEQCYTFYRKLGYDEETATQMTELAKVFYKDGEKALSRALIEEAFRTTTIDREFAVEALIGIGYTEDDSELIITLEEKSVQEKLLKDKISTMVSRYKRGVIDEEKFTVELDALDIPASRRDGVVEIAVLERFGAEKMPSKTDVKEFVLARVITSPQAREMLERIGYSEEDVTRYLKTWKGTAG